MSRAERRYEKWRDKAYWDQRERFLLETAMERLGMNQRKVARHAWLREHAPVLIGVALFIGAGATIVIGTLLQ